MRRHGDPFAVSDTLVFSIEKAHTKGPVPPEDAASLNPLRPHLACAALLSARLPGADARHRCRPELDRLARRGAGASGQGARRQRFADRLRARHPHRRQRSAGVYQSQCAYALFVKACEGRARNLGAGASVPVPRSPTRPPFVAHLVPMRGGGRDIYSGAELLLYLTPVIQQVGPPPEILQALFDLSPTEARVAVMIAEGHSVKLIAENLSVQHTDRAQLKAVFGKTGTGRQGELVNLLRSPS